MNSYSNFNPYSTTSYGSNGPADGGGFNSGGGGAGAGAGGGGGGGFDDNTAGGGFGSPGSASKRAGGNTLRPVTVKQILDAHQAHPDAEFRIDGVEVSQVTLVGTIREITPQSTNVSYRIEDGTGMIDAKQWVDAEQGATTSDLTRNMYVRVTGQLKSFNSKRHIGVHHIRKITDHNEVIFHLLEATSIHLFNTRGPPGGAKTGQSFSRNDTMDEIIQGTTSNSNANPALDHLEPFQKQIMLLVHNAPPTNEGLHVQTIAQNLRMPIAKVMGAVEQLTTDGLLYTTIDDDHVKSTGAEQ